MKIRIYAAPAVQGLISMLVEYKSDRRARLQSNILVNTQHLYDIYTMLDQRRKRWADVV